ncbi:MAG TPA: TMEM175 family protein [Hanamia sp.]
MKIFSRKELPYERVLFFSDAIVAIAITILALNLKLDIPDSEHLQFKDLFIPWRNYLAFILSFINIASFWRTHHLMFTYIQKMDGKLITLNIFWIFFIVTLPFATTLVSGHFGDTPAIFLYSLNIFLLAVFQNFIWDIANGKEGFVENSHLSIEEQSRFRLMTNLDMLNGLVAVIVSFINPILAFVLLFFKIPVFVFATFYIARQKRKK